MRLTANTGRQKIVKNLPSGHHCTTLSDYIFATKAHIDNWKRLIKQQYLLHMSPQYGGLQPTSGWHRSGSLGHPRKFQRVSRLGSVTAATSLNRSQPNFAQCLAISWAGTLHIHFRGSCPVTEFCQVQSSLCILKVLRSHILVVLLHRTWAVGASQSLRRWAQGATYIRHDDHHVGHWSAF